MIETLVGEARERLVQRASREGLATVGYAILDSPLGPLWVAVAPRGVATISYGREPNAADFGRLLRAYGPGIVPDRRRADQLARELDEYFAGRRQDFEVDIDLTALTPFQQQVLRATAHVRYGKLASYAEIARRAGHAGAARATGAAVGANPVPILVPCHRIVASDGTLGGYAGGLRAKRRLLAIERGTEIPQGGWPPASGRR